MKVSCYSEIFCEYRNLKLEVDLIELWVFNDGINTEIAISIIYIYQIVILKEFYPWNAIDYKFVACSNERWFHLK